MKEYAKVRYGKDLRFYVPTHSLINYTTWKILSPEAELLNIPTVDGYIAQIWTGTSREGNVYEGVYRERTFETAFLEYGVMQELVRGTDRRMWFLNDPIEDRPMYTWENYRLNYRKTAVASLLQPNVWHYEICPWPARVFDGKYPRIPKEKSTIPVDRGADAAIHAVRSQGLTPQPIPKQYSTMLSSMFQLFGDMEQADWEFEGACDGVGVFLSDSALYQRSFPDGVIRGAGLGQRLDDVLCKNTHPEGYHREEEGYTLRDYLRSYRQNYKQAILISALLTAGGLLIGYNLYLVGSNAEVFGSVAHILYALEIVIGVELLFLSLYLFAILARVEMKTKALFRYAFAMVHKHLSTTLLCAAIAAAGFDLVYSVHLMTMIFAVSVPCYAITALLEKVFRRYMDE